MESLISEFAGSLVILHDFVVEDGEVEGETKLDWVAWWESDFVGLVVSFEGLLLDALKLVGLGVFCNVAIVVTDHLDEECLGLTVASLSENLIVDHINNSLAVSGQLLFDVGLVSSESLGEFGILGVLLDSGNSAASSTLAADQILEGHREQVALVRANIGTLLFENFLEEVDHVLESLSLLGNTGQKDIFLDTVTHG